MHNFKAWRTAAFLLLLVAVAFVVQGSYIIGPTGAPPITPSTGTPVFVQTAEAHQTGTASPLSVSFGSLPAVNNVVIVAGVNVAGGATGNLEGIVTDNQGNAYSRVTAFPLNGATVAVAQFWCSPVVVSGGTFTVSIASSAASQKGIMVLEYSHTSCNPDKTAGASGATSPYSCGSATTINAKDLLLTSVVPTNGATGTVTFTAPAGFTIRQSQGVVANGVPMAVADNIVSAVGTFTPTFGASQNLASTVCLFTAMVSQ
jgi:hypothetical protein